MNKIPPLDQNSPEAGFFKQTMNTFEAITARKSVRTFNGLKLDDNILSELRAFRDSLNNAGTSEPACFKGIKRPQIAIIDDAHQAGKLGTYGVISGARSFAIMAYGEDWAEQVLAGYLFEKAVLECTRQGISTCWLGGTFNRAGFQEAYNSLTSSVNNVNPIADNIVGIVSPLGHSTHKTRFAERVMRRVARSAHRHPFKNLFKGIEPPTQQLIDTLCNGNTSGISLEEALKAALEMMRLAPSSRNSQPWRATTETDMDGAISTVRIECVTDNKFSKIDFGIGLYHFIGSLAETGHTGGINLTCPNERPTAIWSSSSNEFHLQE